MSTIPSIKPKNFTITPERVLVTPSMAREWLGKDVNTKNRVLKKTHVTALSNAIKSKVFRETGDTIKFGADGVLYDGQHRLAAIILSGIPTYLWIMKGLSPEARLNIDTGAIRRDIADTLTMVHGGDRWKKKVAIVRMIQSMLSDDSRISSDEAFKLHASRSEGIDWASKLPGGHNGMSFTPIAAALAYAYAKDPSAVQDFAEKAQTVEGHTEGSPASVFRENILIGRDRMNSNGPAYRKSIAMKTLRAVMGHLKHESVVQLKVSEAALDYFAPKKVK